jgi:hypothetical protein
MWGKAVAFPPICLEQEKLLSGGRGARVDRHYAAGGLTPAETTVVIAQNFGGGQQRPRNLIEELEGFWGTSHNVRAVGVHFPEQTVAGMIVRDHSCDVHAYPPWIICQERRLPGDSCVRYIGIPEGSGNIDAELIRLVGNLKCHFASDTYRGKVKMSDGKFLFYYTTFFNNPSSFVVAVTISITKHLWMQEVSDI